MTISSIGSNSYAMVRMSAMQSRDNTANPAEMFGKIDTDGSGGLDQTEFQVLADKISISSGQDVDVESLFATYDEDQDGVLSESETQTAMKGNRPEGAPPPPPSGGMTEDLMQMIADADVNEDGSIDATEVDSLVDIINQSTGQELSVDELFSIFDENEDDLLNQDETLAALESNRPQAPPPPSEKMGKGKDTEESQLLSALKIENYSRIASMGSDQKVNLQEATGYSQNVIAAQA